MAYNYVEFKKKFLAKLKRELVVIELVMRALRRSPPGGPPEA